MIDKSRQDFPVTRKLVYMNNGSIAPTPLSTIKACTDFMLKCSEDGPDAPITHEYISSVLKEARIRISHMINSKPEEIVFAQSTTDGINRVAGGLDWKNGGAIVVLDRKLEHIANYLPWLRIARENKVVKLIELKAVDENSFDISSLDGILSEHNAGGTRLVSISHALFGTGAIMPLEEVGSIAHQRGALFCVDAAQTVGSVPVDVQKIGCDFMAFPAFKWICGPTGIGVFYCRSKSSDLINPLIIGGESAALSDQQVIAPMEMPQRLEAGFRNYPGVAGLESSLRYILRLGIENIRKKNMKVAEVLRAEISKIPGIKLHGPMDETLRTSIVSFSSSSEDSATIVKKLERDSIIFAERTAGGFKVVRASPHFFNSEEEASKAAEYIKNIVR
jgi:cysteine desulfurase/selenocysteine lyase